MVKIYRKDTVEIFEAIPVTASNEDEAMKEALKRSTGRNAIVKITVEG